MPHAPPRSATSVRGVVSAVLAAALFALIFYLSGTIDASAEVTFGVRVLITLGCYALALLYPAARRLLRMTWCRLRGSRSALLLFPVLCALVGVQLWLFSWAPLHGHALDASLGFLLLPLAIVLGSRVVLRAEVTRVQWAAMGVALLAVTIAFALTPQFSWVTLVICAGYPAYFIMRRRLGLDNPMAFGVEVAVLAPIAILLVGLGGPLPQSAAGALGLVVVGFAGAAAMAAFLAASRLLPLPLFGLLGYLEPVLLVVVALLLGERLTGADLVVYGLLAVALAVLGIDGFRSRSASTVR
ncbi:EamA family transporter [Leucobacter triazinivorans]|uniref:Permease n=1 Tax=Leucobacter triazinivorans TaxID=1784719 RepID=A0A4P6KFU4_9MICO|nr:permease [Leucobacter triazinivorans]QBE49222.1 permease [Leucobacter triazinivorans]